jgi:hypothetical protein
VVGLKGMAIHPRHLLSVVVEGIEEGKQCRAIFFFLFLLFSFLWHIFLLVHVAQFYWSYMEKMTASTSSIKIWTEKLTEDSYLSNGQNSNT